MKSKPAAIVAMVVVILGLAGAWQFSKPKNSAVPGNRLFSASELTAADGKSGHNCYVAVDGTVYQIKDSPNWQNGEHTKSEGQAYCGADMSNVIDKAPHGRRMLEQLQVVGKLQS